MIQQHVSLITLGVADLARSRAFYEALGWKAHDRSSDAIAFFQLDGLVLGLFPLVELAKDQTRSKSQLKTGAMTLAWNMPSREAVDVAYAEILSHGGGAIKEPQAVFWGGYSGYFADLDGHVWEIAHNPFWSVGPEGQVVLPDVERSE